jgi:hypothetical protein
MTDTVTPATWAELLEAVYAEDWDATLKRHRSSFAYRGMVDASWGMPTSLIRLGGDFVQLEKHMLRNFRKYAHRDVVERDSFWHWLAVAQHHGLPTRLLDWTYSPLVALHFATDDLARMSQDGIVWLVRIPEAHQLLPKPLRTALQEEGSYVFTVEMLSRFELPEVTVSLAGVSVSSSQFRPTRIKDLGDFDRLAKKPFALFMEPPSIDDRIDACLARASPEARQEGHCSVQSEVGGSRPAGSGEHHRASPFPWPGWTEQMAQAPLQPRTMRQPNNSMQRPALRAAADAER